jgi:tetratricopeptide (TPR) repeat protein
MRRSAHFLFAALMVAAPSVHAQSAGDKAAAEALFSDGRRLMSQNNYKEACPKFEASLKLDPGVGAMLNLADCYEKNGQTASAWAEFREASAAARAAGSKDREDLARQRAAALEPKLSRLTVALGKQSAQVTRDGTVLDSAVFGTPMPVDPGKHVIEATAPGKKKWSTAVDVANGARVSVDVPALQEESQVGTSLPAVGTGVTKEAEAPSGGSSTQRTIAIGVGVVGVAGIAVGSVFGLKAQSSWKDADDACPTHTGCTQKAIDTRNDASSQATLSTVAFAVGIVGVAGAAVLWFTAPKAADSETKVSIGVGPTGVLVRGGF